GLGAKRAGHSRCDQRCFRVIFALRLVRLASSSRRAVDKWGPSSWIRCVLFLVRRRGGAFLILNRSILVAQSRSRAANPLEAIGPKRSHTGAGRAIIMPA